MKGRNCPHSFDGHYDPLSGWYDLCKHKPNREITMATLTKKDLLEAIEDMPMNAEIFVHTWEDFEPLKVEGYYKDACMEHKGNVIILEIC